jgi:hypothetical protein
MTQNKSAETAEIEMFRITPLPDRIYETALYTRKTGIWPNERYFTTYKPRYVGKFSKHCQIGHGDGAIHYDIFEKNGQKVRIDYTYEGTTCYREYDPSKTVFAVNPQISRTSTPDPDLFDLQHNVVKNKTACCFIA